MGALWDLIQDYRDRQDWPVSDAQLANRVGVARSTPARWRNPSDLPRPEQLRGIARVCGYPYLLVLDAALTDAGYVVPGETRDDWELSPHDLIETIRSDGRVAAVLAGPGSGRDRAHVLADLLRGRLDNAH